MFLFEIYVLTMGLWVHVSLHFETHFPHWHVEAESALVSGPFRSLWSIGGQNRLLLNLLPKVPHIQQFLQHLNESVYS